MKRDRQSMSDFARIQVEPHYYLHYRDIDEGNLAPLNYGVCHAYCLLHAESDHAHWDNVLLESRVHEADDEAMVPGSDRVQ